jgi:hypothetical protein
METLILFIRYGMRRAWRGFQALLERYGLRNLPPMTTAAAIIALGIAIPMSMRIGDRPSSLSLSLAVQRLRALEAKPDWTMPRVSPEDMVHCRLPVFFWPAHSKATRYRFALYEGDVLRHYTDLLENAQYALPSPGVLKEGPLYRFTVEGFDAQDASLGQIAYASFVVQALPGELGAVRELARAELESAERALVIAGIYAQAGVLHDVRAALDRYIEIAPDGTDSSLARIILAR